MKDDKSDSRAQALIFLGIGGIVAIFIALARGKFQLYFPLSLTFNFILVAVFSTPAYVLSYRAYQLIGASEVSIFSSTGRLWNVVGALLFLHEEPTLNRVIGAIIILIGVAVTCYDKRNFMSNRGIVYVLIAAFLFGIVDINGYYILQSIDASSYQIYAQLIPVFSLLFIRPQIINRLRYYFTLDKGVKITLLSIGDTFGMLALFFAYQAGGKASVIGPLSATRVIVTVIFAMIVLKERSNPVNKIIGAIIAASGVILLL